MYVIKDPVHGHIKLTDLERELLDTREMQRLRGIKQLALTHLVYPGANHTRFEHSLGTAHITGQICDNLGLGEKEKAGLRIAALLHDVGHGAFSHESDLFLEQYLGETHESIAAQKLQSNSIAEILKREGITPSDISSMINGEGPGVIMTSGIGSDRMDYLLRDAYYTGVAYGVIDSERLIHTMSVRDNTVLLEEGGLEAAESLLLARFMMFSTVYSHHAVRIASSMLRRAVHLGLDSGVMRPVDLVSSDDSGVMWALLKDKRAGRLVRMIENRDLYKRALVMDWGLFTPNARQFLRKRGQDIALAAEIANGAGVSEDDVMLDIPGSLYKDSGDVLVQLGGEMKKLSESSDLLNSVKASEEKRLRLVVASPRAHAKKVENAALKALKPHME